MVGNWYSGTPRLLERPNEEIFDDKPRFGDLPLDAP
jgi:hypothetical protein